MEEERGVGVEAHVENAEEGAQWWADTKEWALMGVGK
jgi:hypothetical protein